MMRIIDISQRVFEGMNVYPGDPQYRSRKVCSLDEGDNCEVSELTIGSHCGTHVDAPKHMIYGGAPLEDIPLHCFIGPCRVLDIPADVVTAEMLSGYPIGQGDRILIRTDPDARYSMPGAGLNPAVLDISAAVYLSSCGVALVGIDSLSVEDMQISAGAVHRQLLSSGVAVLEGLYLQDAEEGDYFLSALPLALEGENGSPCRAVLVKE